MRIRAKQGAIGGSIVALIAAVSVGAASETFWVGFLQTLGFALVCVAGVIGCLVLVDRRSLRP